MTTANGTVCEIRVRAPEDLHERARVAAAKRRQSLTQYVVAAVAERLERDEPKKRPAKATA